jgi:hypothetical protein
MQTTLLPFFFFFYTVFSLDDKAIVATPYYSSSVEYSLETLTKRGLPSIASVTPPGYTDYLANIEIPSHEVLNLSFPYCFFKQEMEDWCCGENRSACLPVQPRANSRLVPYSYCFITEKVCCVITLNE